MRMRAPQTPSHHDGNVLVPFKAALQAGITYKGNVTFRSVNAMLDFFPFAGGFHISPGALLYNGNQVTADATVPAGQTFTLNNVDYRSSATNPIVGNGKLALNKAAPMV